MQDAPSEKIGITMDDETNSSIIESSSVAKRAMRTRQRVPWVTTVFISVCTGIFFLKMAMGENDPDQKTLEMLGYRNPLAIWRGAIWALVTTAFIHANILHFMFNVYWLWELGRRLEKAIGAIAYLAFFIFAAAVSSSCQLAVSDSTGIGASGVLYAMFGFMWVSRARYPEFQSILDPRTIRLFIWWLIGCFVATAINLINIGNAAHLSGLLFGAGVASTFVTRDQRRWISVSFAAFVLISFVPLVWCPWSVTWLSMKAYNAHLEQHYEEALKWYSKVIAVQPNNDWAYTNRSMVYTSLNQQEKADEDLNRARQLNLNSEQK
jgi:rhomboid protease GluP